MFKARLHSFVLALAMGLMALPAQAYTPKVLRIGFAPWDNPNAIEKVAHDVSNLLAADLKMPVIPEVTTDYTGVVEAMRSDRIDMAFFPPVAYVRAEKIAKARVILKSVYQGRSAYYSTIITRTDSGIHSLKDLKGKTMAFVDPTSTSGSIYPQVMLLNAGIDPKRDLHVFYAGGHDAVVLAVLNKKVAAGACYSNDPYGHVAAWTQPTIVPNPADRKKIRILSVSKPIPADNIAVRADLDPHLVARIQGIFLKLSSTAAGRAEIQRVYHVDGFAKASPRDYDPVREAFEKVGFPAQ
ncbi:MAG: phosphate/phosphite/phosphonate ABC transporter substrate-binding protein [Cyanobacteria bacterium REEB65]|nr:phosphate/phosphite/phosphonate ABC transporter substrate-binding protein [Cyanobacteria bacterium REEB65]